MCRAPLPGSDVKARRCGREVGRRNLDATIAHAPFRACARGCGMTHTRFLCARHASRDVTRCRRRLTASSRIALPCLALPSASASDVRVERRRSRPDVRCCGRRHVIGARRDEDDTSVVVGAAACTKSPATSITLAERAWTWMVGRSVVRRDAATAGRLGGTSGLRSGGRYHRTGTA
jgi:hypothetical protein